MYQQLSIEYLTTIVKKKKCWFSGKLWILRSIFFSMTSKRIYDAINLWWSWQIKSPKSVCVFTLLLKWYRWPLCTSPFDLMEHFCLPPLLFENLRAKSINPTTELLSSRDFKQSELDRAFHSTFTPINRHVWTGKKYLHSRRTGENEILTLMSNICSKISHSTERKRWTTLNKVSVRQAVS